MLKKKVNSSPLKVTVGDEPLPVKFDTEDPIPVQFDGEDPIPIKGSIEHPLPVYADSPLRVYTQDIFPVEAFYPLPTKHVPLSHVTFFDTYRKEIFSTRPNSISSQ